jgi:CRISPR-associated protein Csx16
MDENLSLAAADSVLKRKRLVSFLGTGRYEPTRHRFPDESMGTETKYFCRAIAEFVRADEIAVVATTEAEAAHGEELCRELRSANLPAPSFQPIPKGESELELWRQFEVIKHLLRPPAGTEVVLDVTHAFRSQPFFTAAVAAFVRAVDREPAALRIFYAAFEARTEDTTPVWELTPFIELVDWAQSMMLFLRTGRSTDVAEPTIGLGRELARRWAKKKEGEQPRLEKLGKALRDFGANLETVRTGDLLLPGAAGSAASLSAALQEAKESAAAIPPLADVLNRLQSEMIDPLLGAFDHLASDAGHRALAGLARLYIEMGRWAEAAAVVREGWITRYSDPGGRAAFGARNPHNMNKPAVELQAREATETRWRNSEEDVTKTIGDIRNDIEHAGFKWQPKPAHSLQTSIRKLVEDFAGLPSVAARVSAAGHTPVFINLSNHPNENWSVAQREAALGLAPEIKDLCFPLVSPEAGIDEIAALADRVVAQLKTEFPGATHAMVQGEFTLAHALVGKLQRISIVCLAATTRREVVEQSGSTKTTRFDFVRFREYS